MTRTHAFAAGKLCRYIDEWAERHRGRAFAACEDGADIELFRAGNPSWKKGRGKPDLVVEVLTPKSRARDRVDRLRSYLKRRIPNYWVVDPHERIFWELVLRGESYVIEQAIGDAQRFRSRRFRGIDIPLAKLWP